MTLRLLTPSATGELEPSSLNIDTDELFKIVASTQTWPDFLIVNGKQVFSLEEWHSGGADYVVALGFFVLTKETLP